MGYQTSPQENLFYTNIILEERVRKNHPLRRINELIDFEFIYKEVHDRYESKGNVSVPPPVILKLMLLLVFYNVRSERELMETVPERLDWLWFLGYDLDSEIPNHSVLSKARNRWGVEAFQRFFERNVWQCVEAGLVDGSKLFMDSSLVQTDASNNSVVNVNKEAFKIHLVRGFNELESRLEEKENPGEDHEPKSGIANRNHISTTDPDASVTRQGKGKPRLQYKTHRSVDAKAENITATEVTPGEVNEAHLLSTLLAMHQDNTQKTADTVVADTKYGTVENYLACYDLGVNAHIPDLKRTQQERDKRSGIFTEEAFQYDPETDIYQCSAGHHLKKRNYDPKRDAFEYKCSAKAEHLGGDVASFVKQMNRKAHELGMTRTVFKNPNGLPAKGQFTTARDIMKLSKAYLEMFPHALAIHSQQTYTYHNITQHNRNCLLQNYPGTDGIKTGFVAKSGYNISATAKRCDTRLIAVVMGARTPRIRVKETEKFSMKDSG